MQNSNPIDNLFVSGLTKKQFIERYKQLKSEINPNDNNIPSIFREDFGMSVSELFDTLNTNNNDDIIDDDELKVLREFSNDNDNSSTVTENDLNVLYDKTIKRISEMSASKTPEEIYNSAVQRKNNNGQDFGKGNAQQNISLQIEAVKSIMTAKQNISESKIERYEKELDNLIITQSNLSEKEKKEYLNNRSKITAINSEIKKKEHEKQLIKEKMELAEAEVEYSKKHKDMNDTAVKKHVEEYLSKYNVYASDFENVTNSLSSYGAQISKITDEQNKLIKKAKSNNELFETRKNEIQKSIELEKNSYNSEKSNYEAQISNLEKAQEYAIAQSAETYPSEYYDEDTENFSYDSQALQDKWKAKWTKDLGSESKAKAKIDSLGGAAFFNKVCAIAQRLNCDANALMGVMNSESGVTADIGNAAGGSAVGLIQFMPSTAKQLGTTSQALKSMSAIEQLNYVEKCINYAKQVGGISPEQKLDSGTLYTLVFLPAYAKRDVLTVKGHKFYNANAGLDRDGDEKITKADMANRVRAFMA